MPLPSTYRMSWKLVYVDIKFLRIFSTTFDASQVSFIMMFVIKIEVRNYQIHVFVCTQSHPLGRDRFQSCNNTKILVKFCFNFFLHILDDFGAGFGGSSTARTDNSGNTGNTGLIILIYVLSIILFITLIQGQSTWLFLIFN